jgi:hypothetical protein
MSLYIRAEDNVEFIYHHEIRKAYPDVVFPTVLTDQALNAIGIYMKEVEQIEINDNNPVDSIDFVDPADIVLPEDA